MDFDGVNTARSYFLFRAIYTSEPTVPRIGQKMLAGSGDADKTC